MHQNEDQYKEIMKDLKSEKMNWDFDEFLKATEKTETTTAPLTKSKSASLPKFFWMAASAAVLIAIGVLFGLSRESKVEQQDQLVKNQILKHKDEFGNGNEIVAVHTPDSLQTVRDSLITDSSSVSNDDEMMDKILPRRGRLKKQVRQFYVQTPKKSDTKKSATPEYKSDYVIINGQRIENEQDAIDLTKYSFRILSENVSKTVAQTEAIPNFINE